jgi:hypothetical protein
MTRAFFQPFKVSSAQRATHYVRKKNRAAVPVTDVTSLATGTITFSVKPSANDTITIGGTVVTFGPGHVAIGSTLASALASLLAFLQASSDVNLVKSTYQVSATALGVTGKVVGYFPTLAASNATVTLSAQAITNQRRTL